MTWKTSVARLGLALGVVSALALSAGADAWYSFFVGWFWGWS
jgi:hypothetical protein